MFEDNAYLDFDNDIIPICKSPRKCDPENKCSKNTRECVKKRKLSIDDNSNQSILIPHSPSTTVKDARSPGFIKRRFPGPAGLLANNFVENVSMQHITRQRSLDDNEDLLLCSQQTYSLFEDGPWKEMTRDFQSSTESQLYEKFNINWIKVNSSRNQMLVNHKVPFLAAILDSLEIITGKNPTVNVTLKDKSGTINGTVLYSLYEEYSDFFTINCVLVLKQFGVLSLQNNHCITITPNNLVNIYPIEKAKVYEYKKESIKRIVVQPHSIEEIWKKYHEAVASFKRNNLKLVVHNNLNNTSRSIYPLPVPKILNNSVSSNIPSTSYKKTLSSVDMYSNSDISLPGTNCQKKFLFKDSKHISDIQSKILAEENQEKKEYSVNCSQVSIRVEKEEHSEIWKNLFEDMNPDSLLDDF